MVNIWPPAMVNGRLSLGVQAAWISTAYFGFGTNALPSITFDGDTDTGLYRYAADGVGICAGGNRMVGIGSLGLFGGDGVNGCALIPKVTSSVGAPSFSFVGDSTTGLYTPGAGAIGFSSAGVVGFTASGQLLRVAANTGLAAGGTLGAGLALGSAGQLISFGSGAPSIAAAKGSLYIRSDGAGTTSRAYINTDGAGTWTAITTVA